MLVMATNGWVSSSPPQFLSPHRKELKQQTRTAQTGKVYWTSSKKFNLETWEQSNPHWSGLLSFWLPFFNHLFPPLGGLQSLIGCALCKWSMNPRPIREGNENRAYVWDQSEKGMCWECFPAACLHSDPLFSFFMGFFFFLTFVCPPCGSSSPHFLWLPFWTPSSLL